MSKNLFIFLSLLSTSAFLQSMEISLERHEKEWARAEKLKDRLDKEDLLRKERKIIAGYFTTVVDSTHKNVLTASGTWIRSSKKLETNDSSLAPLYATRPQLPIEIIHHIFSYVPQPFKPWELLVELANEEIFLKARLQPRPLTFVNTVFITGANFFSPKYENHLFNLFEDAGSIRTPPCNITALTIKNALAPLYDSQDLNFFITYLQRKKIKSNRKSPYTKTENLEAQTGEAIQNKIDQLQGILDRCAQDEAEYTKEQEEEAATNMKNFIEDKEQQ